MTKYQFSTCNQQSRKATITGKRPSSLFSAESCNAELCMNPYTYTNKQLLLSVLLDFLGFFLYTLGDGLESKNYLIQCLYGVWIYIKSKYKHHTLSGSGLSPDDSSNGSLLTESLGGSSFFEG